MSKYNDVLNKYIVTCGGDAPEEVQCRGRVYILVCDQEQNYAYIPEIGKGRDLNETETRRVLRLRK